MVGIICSSFFHWYSIHDSKMYITRIKCNSRRLHVVSKIQVDQTPILFFLKMPKNTIQISGNEET